MWEMSFLCSMLLRTFACFLPSRALLEFLTRLFLTFFTRRWLKGLLFSFPAMRVK